MTGASVATTCAGEPVSPNAVAQTSACSPKLSLHPTTDEACARAAEDMNRACHCITIDLEALRRELESDRENADLYRSIAQSRPHLFSGSPVFVGRIHVERITAIVHAVEQVVALPVYRQHVLARTPEIARRDHGPLGVFLGYDFHLGPNGPKLIEINTNAGGPLLNSVLARAQSYGPTYLQAITWRRSW